MTARLLTITPLLPLLVACAAGQPKQSYTDDSQTMCIEPRPQICTMDYTPVCAELNGGELKTYSNACTACADVNVVSHRAAACE